MSLVLHLLRADVRRFRLLIAALLLLSAAVATTNAVGPLLTGEFRELEAFQLARTLIRIVLLLVTAVAVPIVVQAHPLVGSTAFWLTRPIAAGTLLASKLVLLGSLTVLVPVTTDVLLMTAYEVPIGALSRVVLQTALVSTFWLVALFVIATLTENLTRFVLVCSAMLAAVAVGSAILTSIAMAGAVSDAYVIGKVFRQTAVTFSGKPVFPYPLAATPDPTPAVVAGTTGLTIGALIVVVQYRRRSVRASVCGGVVGLVMTGAITIAWPWPILRPRVEIPNWARTESSPRLVVDRPIIRMERPSSHPRWWPGRLEMYAAGVPSGWLASVAVADAELVADGHSIKVFPFGFPTPVRSGPELLPPMLAVLRNALGVRHVSSDSVRHLAEPVSVAFRDSGRQPPPVSGRYSGQFVVSLSRHERVAALPLERGATHRAREHRVVVDRISNEGDTAVVIRVRASSALSVFDRRMEPSFRFFLRNAAADTVIEGHPQDMSRESFLYTYTPLLWSLAREISATYGFNARALLIRFHSSYVLPSAAEGASALLHTHDAQTSDLPRHLVTIDENWLSNADLVILRSTQYGSVMRAVDLPHVEIQAP